MAWHEPTTLGGAFDAARAVLVEWFPKSSPGETYTGMSAFSRRHGAEILAIVMGRLRELLRGLSLRGGCWKVHGWVLIGGDGTRAPAPRTKRNLAGLGGMGRDRKNPQAWLTLLLHLPTGLLWSFVADRGDAAERGHVKSMLGTMPEDSLYLGDAGFVGYDFWNAMMESGQGFLIRVGSNVSLIKGLARATGAKARIDPAAGIVWLWPRRERKGKKRPGGALMLRLIVLHDGKKPVYLVTNVLDCKRLTADHAREFYRMRWGVELWFRALKQTMNRPKLRSCAPDQAKLELSWMAVSLGVLGLLHLEGLIKAGEDPRTATVAGALKVVREGLSRPGGRRRGKSRLLRRLGEEKKDAYVRGGPKRTGRYPKKNNRKRPSGSPKIRDASEAEKRKYQELVRRPSERVFTA